MTGVLASLAGPLASAQVSLFAMSTFDTDYMLVKAEALERAVKVLKDAGHDVTLEDDATKYDDGGGEEDDAPRSARNPRDGPAVEFEPDPVVSLLVNKQRNEDEEEKRQDQQDQQSFFNLCLVAGWPPVLTNPDRFRTSYEKFRAAVEQCWDASDRPQREFVSTGSDPLLSSSNLASVVSPLYLYPYEHLHTTVATFFRPGLERVPIDQQEKLRRLWTQVLDVALKDQGWPTQPFSLRIESAQVGSRAGILLWKDESGSMEAMRECLRRAAATVRTEASSSDCNSEELDWLGHLDVPPIIHSTFLRFCSPPPRTDGAAVQERFQADVLSKLGELFPEPFRVPAATFVCERTPYMHIPFDNHHVLATLSFTRSASSRYLADAVEALKYLRSMQVEDP
jgi:hypothetical protein